MLGKSPIRWTSKRQSIAAHSTAEAECYAADIAAQELSNLAMLLAESGHQEKSILYCDNQPVIRIISNNEYAKKGRYFLGRVRFLSDAINRDKWLSIQYVPSKANTADLFTKPLPRVLLEQLTSTSRNYQAQMWQSGGVLTKYYLLG